MRGPPACRMLSLHAFCMCPDNLTCTLLSPDTPRYADFPRAAQSPALQQRGAAPSCAEICADTSRSCCGACRCCCAAAHKEAGQLRIPTSRQAPQRDGDSQLSSWSSCMTGMCPSSCLGAHLDGLQSLHHLCHGGPLGGLLLHALGADASEGLGHAGGKL